MSVQTQVSGVSVERFFWNDWQSVQETWHKKRLIARTCFAKAKLRRLLEGGGGAVR
jgi:hypothetical protein